ncbi:hypothetical protein HanPSC8_Chr02g0076161 [Helianthus annuus]|nr:hypothetical protein HanPSC8_Chr02g0076161 [Helianthus annuus]
MFKNSFFMSSAASKKRFMLPNKLRSIASISLLSPGKSNGVGCDDKEPFFIWSVMSSSVYSLLDSTTSDYLPTQSLRSCSVFWHFLMNFLGSTSSVLHCEDIIFLVEHRASDLGLLSSNFLILLEFSSSSSFHTQPIVFASQAIQKRQVFI